MTVPARSYPYVGGFRLIAALLIGLFCSSAMAPLAFAWPAYPDPAHWPVIVADRFQFHVQPIPDGADAPDGTYFTTEYYPQFEAALSHAETVLGVDIAGPIDVDVYSTSGQFRGRIAKSVVGQTPYGEVVLDLEQQRIVVDMQALLASSPVSAEDAVRNALAQFTLGNSTANAIPPALQAGVALYLNNPTPELLARLTAELETAQQQDTLFTWFDLFTLNVSGEEELTMGQSYSIVATLIDRYDISSLRAFLTAIGTGSPWSEAMRTAYQSDATTLENDWRANLPSWIASGWRDNLMASFDLQPSRDLLTQGQYAAAKATLGPAQNLYRQLDDTEALAEVQTLIGQADTGIQAEALMVEIETALNAFDYVRASNLLDQVETQFAVLPADQVPSGLLDSYRQIASDGTIALGQLQTASRLASSWGQYPEARAAAKEAGNTFALLGDDTRHAESVAVVDKLDNRQRRLVVLLAGLGLITLAWLFFWLRARGPSDVVWAQ